MKIKEITSRLRRDFWAIYICEHCGYETGTESGYDDANFHQNVIPDMACESCGKKGLKDTPKVAPRYPENLAV